MAFRISRPARIAAATIATSTCALAGNVFTVATTGPADFAQIQPAVDAAVDGDTILVKPGTYTGFVIDGKALTVVGDVGTAPSIAGRVGIKNIALGQTLTMARIQSQGINNTTERYGLEIDDCAGALRFAHCRFTGRNGSAVVSNVGEVGVHVDTASNVGMAMCVMLGGSGASSYTCLFDVVGLGSTGLHLESASLVAHECAVTGGHGGNGGDRTGSGGAGVFVQVASLFFGSRCTIIGGHGGNTDCSDWGTPADGGAGMGFGATSVVQLLGSTVLGGMGGVSLPTGPGADHGEAFSSADPFVYGVPSLGFATEAVAREGTTVDVTFTGEPGDQVYLNDALSTVFQGVPSWRGFVIAPFASANHPGAPRVRRWGVIPASGVLTKTYRVPALPSGVEAQTRFLQAYRLHGTGLTLGSFATLTVLDSAF
ncbi:MAG: hypothetical protein ACKVWV_12050 [Planctomycetota bacterium]